MLWGKLSFVQCNLLHCNFIQTLCHQCQLLRIRTVSRSPYLRIHSLSSGSDISDIDAKPESPEADFVDRHIGPSQQDINHMLQFCGFNRIEDFIAKVIPEDILLKRDLKLENQTSEAELIKRLKLLMNKNEVWRSYIGQGYYGTITPSVIQRNIFENPDIVTSRAKSLDIEIEIVSTDNVDHVKELINTRQFAGYLLQYPDTEGNIWDEKIRVIAELTKSNKVRFELYLLF
ncbi:Glycine dehydrogenase [Schistosoma japonicum]|nr:Glycine dehydrogenase [Schistosoma japonicum]